MLVNIPDILTITNDGNKANIVTNAVNGTNNILLLSSFFDLFNKEITCNCTKNIYEKDKEINIIYTICNKENCNQDEGLKRLGVTELKLDIKDDIPITYTIYTKDKKEYACIFFNKFYTNIEIDNNIFNISK